MGIADRRVDRSHRGLPAHKRGGEYARAIASKKRLGRIRRAVHRAFILSDGQPILARTVLERSYPRLKVFLRGHRRAVWRALLQEAQVIARNRFGRGRANLWARRDMGAT
jgi:hypothetical protein